MQWIRRFGVAGFVCLLGCGSSSNPKLAVGKACRIDGDCASGLSCLDTGGSAACEAPCKSSSDCHSGQVCNVESPSYCTPSCTGDYLGAGSVCVNGVPTACSSITDGSHCQECNRCPSTQRCDPTTDRCGSLATVGAPCTANADCDSANCGIIPGADGGGMQCFVKAGAPCTTLNCGSCVTTGTTTACEPSCTASGDINCGSASGTCPGANGEAACLGAAGAYYCRQPCDAFNANGCGAGFACQQYLAPVCSSSLYDEACFPTSLAPPPPSCTAATSGCPSGAKAYSCTGGATPWSAASAATGSTECEPGQVQSGNTLYCCVSDVCVADPVATSQCSGGTGYACGGSAAPPATNSTGLPTLCTLLDPPSGSHEVADYCCKDATCAPSSSVSCPGGTTAYSCTGTATPDLTLNDLVCPFAASGGSGGYCCRTSSSGCTTDTSVPCGAGQFGYSCVGASSTPTSAGFPLNCTLGKNVKGKNEYCCDTPATCSNTPGLGCGSPYTAWLCAGNNVPSASACGVGAAVGNNLEEYCCQ